MNWLTSLLVAAGALIAVAMLIIQPGLRPALRLSTRQRRRLSRWLPWYRQLNARRRKRLCDRTACVMAYVEVLGGPGHKPTERQRLLIAAQIGLLCLGARPTEFRLPSEIVVHADAAAIQRDPAWSGVVEDIGELATGQTWETTRLHLSWPAVAAALDGAEHNPIVRSLARLQDFSVPATDNIDCQTWGDALEAERQSLRASGSSWLPEAGEIDMAEFFSRAAELFFQRGDALASAHPGLYALLAAYFDIEIAAQHPTGHRMPSQSTIKPRRT